MTDKNRFATGQTSLETLKVIIQSIPEIDKVVLIEHEVNDNWRQSNHDTESKLSNLESAFNHDQPKQTLSLNRNELLKIKQEDLEQLQEGNVWSIVSKVQIGNLVKHIAMMNFHPENDNDNKDISIKSIEETLSHICGDKTGVILHSGRYYHYYGNFLLDEKEWIRFMSEFLMPCVIVSPRYVGHRLYDGYATLRITNEQNYKPTIPKTIKLINPN